jgi:hypothetical protein
MINVVGGFLITDRMLKMFKGASAGPPAALPQATPSVPAAKPVSGAPRV